MIAVRSYTRVVDARILVVEDDLTVAEVVVDYLRHAGLEPQQRIQLEQGSATAHIKAAAWRALEAHGVPIDQLVAAAASYLEKHPESPQPSRYTWIIVGART